MGNVPSDIVGLDFWNDRLRHHVQENNPQEEQLRKDEIEEGGPVRGWLETCGPTALTTVCDCAGYNIEVKTPGGFRPQEEGILADYLNHPSNYPKFKKIRPDIDFSVVQGNRYPNLFPLALMEVFAVPAVYYPTRSWEEVAADLQDKRGVVFCLKDPSHFLAGVAFDRATQEIIYHDSYRARTGTDGFRLRMFEAEYRANVNPNVTVIARRNA